MNKYICPTIAAVCMLVAVSGCSHPHSDARSESRRTVVVVRPQRGDIIRSITLPGDLVGLYQSTLYAKVTGYLKTISVDKGDWVKEGQVLAVIEVPELQERLARSRADLEVQHLTYQRLEQVWKSDPRLVARQDVEAESVRRVVTNCRVVAAQILGSYVVDARVLEDRAKSRLQTFDVSSRGLRFSVSPCEDAPPAAARSEVHFGIENREPRRLEPARQLSLIHI